MGLRLRLGRERRAGHLQDASGGSEGMTDTGLGDSPTAVQCPLCPNWARSDSWHIRHAERIRELEAELADAIRIREVNRKLSDDWMARAEKAEARVAELERELQFAIDLIGPE